MIYSYLVSATYNWKINITHFSLYFSYAESLPRLQCLSSNRAIMNIVYFPFSLEQPFFSGLIQSDDTECEKKNL